MKKILKTVLLFAAGAAASYFMNLLVSPKERKKTKKQLQTMIERVDWDGVGRKMFKKSGDRMRQKFKEVMEDFQEKVKKISDSVESFDGKPYKKMVDSFVEKLEEDSTFTKVQVKKINDYLNNEFGRAKN